MRINLVSFVILGLFTSCGSFQQTLNNKFGTMVSTKKCQSGDWFEQGKIDVLAGEPWRSRLKKFEENCAEKKVNMNVAEYKRGVEYAGPMYCTGLKDFYLQNKWESVGHRDALNGLKKSAVNDYKNKCFEYYSEPNKEEYFFGYNLGIQKLCTKKSGFDFAIQKKKYTKTCPRKLEKQFLLGYKSGELFVIAEKLQIEAENIAKKEEMAKVDLNLEEQRLSELQQKYSEFDFNNSLGESAMIEKRIIENKSNLRRSKYDGISESAKNELKNAIKSDQAELKKLKLSAAKEKSGIHKEILAVKKQKRVYSTKLKQLKKQALKMILKATKSKQNAENFKRKVL